MGAAGNELEREEGGWKVDAANCDSGGSGGCRGAQTLPGRRDWRERTKDLRVSIR